MPFALGCSSGESVEILVPARDVVVVAGDSISVLAAPAPGPSPGRVWNWRLGQRDTSSGRAALLYVGEGVGRDSLVLLVHDDGGAAERAVRGVEVVAPVPVGNYALRFGGTGRDDIDRVKILIDDPGDSAPGPGADIGGSDFTVELWIRARAEDNLAAAVTCGANVSWINGNIVLDRDRYNQGRKFGLSLVGGRVAFGVSNDADEHVTVCGTTHVTDDAWHHVAITRRLTGAIVLFVDGRPDGHATGPAGDISYPDDGVPGDFCNGPCLASDPYLVIGAEKHDAGPDYPSFAGEVDELRLSSVLRYHEQFDPPTVRFRPDSATAALYHFDEGAGDVVHDHAPGPRPSPGWRFRAGPPGGPHWVRSTAPTGG